MVDLNNFEEVVKAIEQLDISSYFSRSLYNLMASVSWLRSGNKWSKYSDAINNIEDMIKRLAQDSYLQLMENKRNLAGDVTEDLFKRWLEVPEDNVNKEVAARFAYEEASDKYAKLCDECKQINEQIYAIDLANSPFSH